MKDTKYFIEITTNDERETLIKCEHVTGWAEANKKIEMYKKYSLDNIKIDIYKEIDDNVIHCGNFTNIKEHQFELTPKKKTNDKMILSLVGIVLFPIMLLYYLIKGD